MPHLLTAPCVNETSLMSPLAEPSVYLPSREWHQQPGPKEMRQRGLPGARLPAWVTQPSQKSKQMKSFVTVFGHYITVFESHSCLIYCSTALYIVCDLWWESGLCTGRQGEDPSPAEHHAGVDRCAAVYWTCQGGQVLTLTCGKKRQQKQTNSNLKSSISSIMFLSSLWILVGLV